MLTGGGGVPTSQAMVHGVTTEECQGGPAEPQLGVQRAAQYLKVPSPPAHSGFFGDPEDCSRLSSHSLLPHPPSSAPPWSSALPWSSASPPVCPMAAPSAPQVEQLF